MKLYEINEALMNCIDEDTGEITDLGSYEALNIEREDKLENIALWVKNLTADVQAYKAEKAAFAEKQARAEKKIESLKALLERELDGQPLKRSRVDVTFRRSESVIINDVYALPAEYQHYSEPTADKKAIKDALKAGQEVPGAELESKLNMMIK